MNFDLLVNVAFPMMSFGCQTDGRDVMMEVDEVKKSEEA